MPATATDFNSLIQQLMSQYGGNSGFGSVPLPTGTVGGFSPNVTGTPGPANATNIGTANSFASLLPIFQQALNQQILPTALSNLQASGVTSGPLNQLMTQLFAQYGPQLNAIGSGITGQNMAGFVNNQNTILGGAGTDLLKTGYNASQIFDAPYYQARQQTADSLGKLLSSIDVSGNLSGSETNQIGQGLARQDVQKGTLNAPSQAGIVSNAMQYGNAAFQRKATEQGIMGNAIGAATSFLPQSKSGVNVFGTGTGAGAPANPGAGLFTGVNTNFGNSIGSEVLGGQQQTANTNLSGQFGLAGTDMNIQANQKDWADYLSQVRGNL